MSVGTLAVALTLAALPPAFANPLIRQAREAGALDAQTALLYRVYEALDPAALPPPYTHDADRPRGCGTPLLVEALSARDESTPDYSAKLARTLARPALAHSAPSPSGRFRIHYATEGRDAVADDDADANGIPDYVDLTAVIADSMWVLEVEELGYNPPPRDGAEGGGDQYDIYIQQLGSGYYGFTHPEHGGPTTPTYIRIENDFVESQYGVVSSCAGARGTRELAALRVTIAHEFFHMIQFGYYQGRTEGDWWQESSATWMEEVAYPQADDYLQYLCDFLLPSSRSLDSGSQFSSDRRIYGSSIFSHFLAERYGRDIVREIWDEHGRRASALMENFDRILRRHIPGGLDDAVNEFGVWNYFTGSRFQEGFYAEGFKYPEIPVEPVDAVAGEAVKDSGRVDHLASAYILLEPRFRTGGVTLTTELERSRWRRRLVQVSPDGVEVTPLDNSSPVGVDDWDLYDEILLVVSNTDVVGINFRYTVAAQYDPQMTDQPLPLAFVLGDSYPNPFLPGRHAETSIPYERNTVSFATTLSIFTAAGELVREYDLDQHSPRAYTASWDGRNADGELVSSGMYHLLLTAAGRHSAGTLAVIRE